MASGWPGSPYNPPVDDTPPDRELTWLRRLQQTLGRVATERDPGRLLPLVLDAAIELTAAQRGFLVRVTPVAAGAARPKLRIEVARGFDKATLRGAASEVSRTAVDRVLARGGPVLTSGADQDVTEVSSVVALQVQSILCVPLRVGDEVRGVIYLDHRDRDAFQPHDVAVAQAFADQAGLALDASLARTRPSVAPAPRDLEPLLAAPWPPEILTWGTLVGGGPAFRAMTVAADAHVPLRTHVLILGEAGSGRRRLAQELHARGPAAKEPLVTVSCVGLDPAAQVQELLGKAGARARPGALVRAGRGAVLLLEVDRLVGEAKDGLARALEQRAVRPPGATKDLPIECRILATTTQAELALLSARGVAMLRVPPLRDRPEDVLPLLRSNLRRLRTDEPTVTREAAEQLLRCAWRGNVGQLEEEARHLAGTGLSRLGPAELSPSVRGGGVGGASASPLAGKTLLEIEKEAVETALREAGGNRTLAAKHLGVPKSTLYDLLNRHGLK